ncbi:MAG: hypothetical protein C0483_26165 [Pirellula sp.]|nr:hypothetical protein [Pirellula sp.]
MRYNPPDDRAEYLHDPTPAFLASILREKPYTYWQAGGNGEATLEVENGGPMLSIKQPIPGRFFILRLNDWTVPYDGGSCDDLLEDEYGGNRFLIPVACTISTDDAVRVLSHFVSCRELWPGVPWQSWSDLPLPTDYPHEG